MAILTEKDINEYVGKLMKPHSVFPGSENDKIIDDAYHFFDDDLNISITVAEDSTRSKIRIESWLRDYLRKNKEGREKFMEETLKAINNSIDGEGVNYVG